MTSENQRRNQQVTVSGITKEWKNISKNEKYLLIKKVLDPPKVNTEIAFLIGIMLVFEEFMTKFQREELVIHLSHPGS